MPTKNLVRGSFSYFTSVGHVWKHRNLHSSLLFQNWSTAQHNSLSLKAFSWSTQYITMARLFLLLQMSSHSYVFLKSTVIDIPSGLLSNALIGILCIFTLNMAQCYQRQIMNRLYTAQRQKSFEASLVISMCVTIQAFIGFLKTFTNSQS